MVFLAAAGVALTWVALDRFVGWQYALRKPWLESLASRSMGNPLRLGPYGGLRPLGLAAGPSRFLPASDNPSTIEVSAVSVRLAPLASLLERNLVLQFELADGRVDLRRNSKGSFWRLGVTPPSRRPPRVSLRFALANPARLTLHAGRGTPLDLRFAGSLALNLPRRQLFTQVRVSEPKGGRLALVAHSNWQNQQWRVKLRPDALPLEPLLPLLPDGLQAQLSGRLQGQLHGALTFERSERSNRCQGQLQLQKLRWSPASLRQPLQASSLDLRCTPTELRLARSPLQWGPWRGQLQGQFQLVGRRSGRLELTLNAESRQAQQRLKLQLGGPWRDLNLDLDGQFRNASLRANARLRKSDRWTLALPQLLLRQGGGELRLAGELFPRLELRSQGLRLGPQQQKVWGSLLGRQPQLQVVLRQVGGWSKPQLQLDLRQASNPLLGSLAAQLRWRPGQIALEGLRSPYLQAQGLWRLQGNAAGPLQLDLDLKAFPLARLSALVGSRLQGSLDARGRVSGSLAQLKPDLQLRAHRPGVGPLWFEETWSGSLQPTTGAGLQLRLSPHASPLPGLLWAQLDRRWLPSEVRLERGDGLLRFSGTPRRYSWSAQRFPLSGLQLALWPQATHQPLSGLLSGEGLLDLQPLWIRADVAVQQPQLLGLFGRQLQAQGEFRNRRFQLSGRFGALGSGSIGARLRGEQGGPLWLRLEGRGLNSQTLQELLAAAPQWRGAPLLPRGSATDLKSVSIRTQNWSVAEQLQALAFAQQDRAVRQRLRAEATQRASLQDLQGLMDADLTLVGPRPDRLFIDLAASGHLWLQGPESDQALTQQRLQVRLKGPLSEGGSFDLQQVPLALLALVAPVPDGLRGSLGAQGRYSLARGRRRSEVELNLSLQDASLAAQPLQLERGQVRLDGDLLSLDWQLRSGSSQEAVDLKGQIPLVASQQGLELRMASRGDGLRFLSYLAGPGLQWRQGSADLQLLVRGSLLQPVANGFLRFSDGDLQLAGQRVQDLDAILLFDFSSLELQSLTARVGEKGRLSGTGALSLFQPSSDLRRRLRLTLVQAPFKLARMAAQADGDLLIGGSLLRPVISGELTMSNGSINVQPGQLATEAAPTRPVSMPALLESNWDFNQPLLVMGQQLESTTSQDLRAAVPSLRFLSFNGLRLRFGRDLRVEVPNVLNFRTAGLLTLNGPMDPSIRISGVVRLLSGRLGLFTTTFSLDPDSPNVAVFTPALGLIPYLDVVLRTRVSDSLPVASGIDRSNLYDWNLNGAFSSFDQLRLVRVRVEIAGPADRLAQSIRLTSTPPLPEDRLLALVGGNSLVGLVGGNAGAALATVVGQSLLSPVVGSLTELLGQRLTFALYPTYVLPNNFDAESNRSGQVPSQLVLASDIGLDITERFNASVLAAPNRSDIAPQMTVRYQAKPWLGLQTSIDTESRWQTQMQVFFRF